MTTEQKHNLQIWLAVVLSLSGLIILFMGLYIPPIGVIDNSVLIGYGEISTFAGALIGIDYKYRYTQYLHRKTREAEEEPETPDYPND